MNELDIHRKANELLHKGKYQEAAAEYEALIAEQKKPNPAILNLIGDLQIKQGNFEKGFESYLRASRTYAEEGLFHNGIAVGKKVLRLDKEQTEVYGMLGQLYARQGLGMDCVKFLGEYARRMDEAGEYPTALAAFAEACEILEDFPDVHAAHAEMLEKVGRDADAAVAYDRAANACRDREMQAEAMDMSRRAARLRGEPADNDGNECVSDLMNLRNLDGPAGPPARLRADSAKMARRFGVFDPTAHPDIPPPPPLPPRPGAAPDAPAEPLAPAATGRTPVAPPPPPTIELDSARLHGAIDLDGADPDAPARPEPDAIEFEPASSGGTDTPAETPPPVLEEFFEANAGSQSAESQGPGGEERAVVVGDDFELVREGGDVQEVINDFIEATMELLDLDDHQSHYDLGTTYMEMELFDEAAAEFEISARGSGFALPSQEMLGYCFLRKGQIDLAIRELKKGLAIEGYDDRDKLGLLYNLGIASRVLDQEQEAIEFFRRILEIDPDFRDTRSRLERLVAN